MKTREDAQVLLREWVSSDSLRRHCLGVAVCMEAYAKKKGLSEEEIDNWFICGLLHDFDYEKYPDINVHPKKGCEKLKEEDYSEEIIEAIMGHNEVMGVERKSDMAKALFAVDELSGLVYALARIRPGNFVGMSPKSVKKVMKKKDFAAAINRDDIRKGMSELNLETDEQKNEHFELIIKALENVKKDLGF